MERFWRPVRVLELDGAYVLGWVDKLPVLVAADLGTGEPMALGYVNERNPKPYNVGCHSAMALL